MKRRQSESGKRYKMEKILKKMRKLNISGNVIPMSWYQTIRRKGKEPCGRNEGNPYHTAIMLLGDIVYWYRPTEIRDEVTGAVIGYKKKFHSDLLQKNYESYANQFGISKRQAQESIIFLEKLGVIKRIFRNVPSNGTILVNVLYLSINPDRLEELTYPEETINILEFDDFPNESEPEESLPYLEKNQCQKGTTKMLHKIGGGVTQKRDTSHTAGEVLHRTGGGVTQKWDTSYENTEDIYIDYYIDYYKDNLSIHQSSNNGDLRKTSCGQSNSNCGQLKKEKRKITLNFDYQYLTNLIDKNVIDEIIMIIQDVCRMDDKDCLSIQGKRKLVSEVKERMSCLTNEHLIYAAEAYLGMTKKVKNPKNYMISCLYNAPITFGLSLRNQVASEQF